jgi:Zn-dependent M28 family amino/carboxypeptidase
VLSTEIAPRNSEHTENLAGAAAYISGRFKDLGLKPRDQKYEADGKPYKNVIARVRSSVPEVATARVNAAGPPLIVVGAHYDSYGELPAADDNASGVAGLLELARLLAANPAASPVELVAYTLEEPPYFRTPSMGSFVHSRSLKSQGARVLAMFSLEMIGYFTDASGTQEFPMPLLKLLYPSTGNYIAIVGDLENRALARAVRTSMRSVMTMRAYSINAPRLVPGIDFSDQLSYWTLGYPGIMVTDTSFYRNKAYHTEGDTPDRLDYARMADVVSGVYQAVIDLAAAK